MDVISFFTRLSLIWQEMDLYREIVWNCPNDGIQYSPKFDIVCGRILNQRPIASLMKACYEVCLEEDRTSAMSSLINPVIDFVAFSARFSTCGSEKHSGKAVPILSIAKNSGTPRNNVRNYMVVPQEVRNNLPTTN